MECRSDTRMAFAEIWMISVIIPFKGDWKILSDCIESIIASDLVSEILIGVDGKIEEQNGDILQLKKFKNLRILEYPDAQGIALVLNRLFKLAKNDFIARMDADDEVIENRFRLQLKILQESRIAVLGGNVILKSNKSIPPRKIGKLNCSDFLSSNPVAHPTIMFRKSLILKALDTNEDLYCPNYRKSQDYELWQRIVRKAEIHNCADPLVIYNDAFNKLNFLKQHYFFSRAMIKNLWYHFVCKKCKCGTKFTFKILCASINQLLIYPAKVMVSMKGTRSG